MTMDSALLNIVRKSYISATTEHDHTAGELFQRHDEIALVDPNGDPCAIPMDYQEDSIDFDYNYTTGDKGSSLRGSLINPSLSIDYIDNVVARKLEQWKRERAVVYLSPNMGRNTLFSWRAADVKVVGSTGVFTGGGGAYDTTGNFAIKPTFGSYLRYWDQSRRQFVQKTTSNRAPLVATPGGAGIVTFGSVVNRMAPTYPKSATLSSAATASGWVAGGTNAADISATFVSGGFGHTECPDTLRVAVAGRVTTDRYLVVSDQFNSAHANYGGYTFVDGTNVTATIWMRGKMPDAAVLQLGAVGVSDYTNRSLAGLRLDGWTPVTVQHRPTSWTGHVPLLAILLNDTIGQDCEFEIGPTMVIQQSGYSAIPAAPVWSGQTTAGTASGSAYVATTAALRLPGQGTVIASYYAPDDSGSSWRATSYCVLAGNSDISLRVGRSAAGGEYFYVTTTGSNWSSYDGAAGVAGTVMVPGAVNTVAVTWSPAGVLLYVNGELVATDTATLPILGGSSSAWKIGSSVTSYGCAPLAMLTCRIDEGAMTSAQIKQIHRALTDPIALGFAISCRGRAFRITDVPRVLRPSAGGSQVLGNIRLEQVGYDQFTADPFARELSIV